MLHGFSRPRATADTRTRMPSAVSSTTGQRGQRLARETERGHWDAALERHGLLARAGCDPAVTMSATVNGATAQASFEVRTVEPP